MSYEENGAPGVTRRVTCDVCVICAKIEELRAVKSIFSKIPSFKEVRGDARTDLVYEVEQRLTVKITTCADMGHISAAVKVAEVISKSRPEIIIFVGTAASLKPQDIQLGDVVIPKKAVIRIYDKVSESGQKDYELRKSDANFKEFFFDDTALISESSTILSSDGAMDLVGALDIGSFELQSKAGESITLGDQSFTTRISKVHDDVDIFSCGMVVDSLTYRDFIVSNANLNLRKVAIIDMESHGFFTAIRSIPTSFSGSPQRCHGIMVRGISDYAGRKSQTEQRSTDWKSLAVKNAAIVAAEIISVISSRSY